MATRPGFHRFHVELRADHWDLLKSYCYGSPERITASAIVNNLVGFYVEECLRPRLDGEPEAVANFAAVTADMQRTAAAVAHKIEPTAFPEAK